MGKIKSELSRVSLSQLSVLTGKAPRTLKMLLVWATPRVESGTLFYNSAEVLTLRGDPAAGAGAPDTPEGTRKPPDCAEARARLDTLKADKVHLEVEQLRGKLIPADEVQVGWEKFANAIRSRVLAMPSKIGPRLKAAKDLKELEKIFKAECHEALKELAQYGSEPADGRAGTQSS